MGEFFGILVAAAVAVVGVSAALSIFDGIAR